MKSKPRVYVLNQPVADAAHGRVEYDLSDAKRFTDEPFIVVTRGGVRINQQLIKDIAEKLKDFQPQDFLLVSGSAALAVVATSVLKDTFGIEVVKTLLYQYNLVNPDTGTSYNGYVPTPIDGYVEGYFVPGT